MSTPFQRALLTFLDARENHLSTAYTPGVAQKDVDDMAQVLAQAGDGLERVVRQMMREERRPVHYVGPTD